MIKLLLKLTLREAWYHRSRMVLALAATIACACMIVSLVGTIDLMLAQVAEDGENFLGEYQFAVLPDRTDPPRAPGEEEKAERSGGSGKTGKRPRPGIPPVVLEQLRSDPFVQRVDPARVESCTLIHPSDEIPPTENPGENPHNMSIEQRIPSRSPSLIALDVEDCPFELREGRWYVEDTNRETAAMEGVLGTGIANHTGSRQNPIPSGPVRPGMEMIVKIGDRSHRITIVGLVEQKMSTSSRGGPGRGGGGRGVVNPVQPSLFVSPKTAEKLTGEPDRADFLYLKLRDGTDPEVFPEKWISAYETDPEGALEGGPLKLRFLDAEHIQKSLNAAASQNPGGGVGMLMGVNTITILFFATVAAVFIVFTTLSMGVGERTRTFAMLRSVGMNRGGVAALVFGESLVLCVLGWIGGLFSGWLLLQSSIWLQPGLRETGTMVSLRWETIATTGFCVFLGSLLATIVPAWRATRISPLQGMDRGYAQEISKSRFYLAGVLGIGFLLIDPLIVFGPGLSAAMRITLYYYLGLPSLVIGWILLAPAAILLIEKLFTAPVAKILGIPGELLAGQLSSNLWRTLGTTVSICIGLGLYTMFQIWGYSMLVPFLPSEKTPDTLITLLPTGIPPEEVENARKLPGVDPERFLALDIEQLKFSKRQFESDQFSGLWRSADNVVLFGLDPKKAFLPGSKGEKPLIELDFLQGTVQRTVEKMSEPGGRYCVIPDSFSIRAGLRVGDKLELVVPEDLHNSNPTARVRGPDGTDRPDAGEAERARERVGREREEPTGAAENILEYEICGIVSFPGSIWMSKTAGVRSRYGRTAAIAFAPAETVRKDFELRDVAFFWFDRTAASSKEQLEREFTDFHARVGDRVAGSRFRQGLGMPFGSRIMAGSPTEVRITTTESITEGVSNRSTQVIQSVAKMPLVILAISSIAMMGTMSASVRTRSFQFGVLRSLGVSRGGLIRIVLGEAMLIAVASIGLSLGFGMLTAWCSAGLATYVSIFGSTVAGFVLPWKYLGFGFAAALGLCFLAAIGPALFAAYREPAVLLRES